MASFDETIKLLRAAVPADPLYGCCDAACYDCSMGRDHPNWCTWAALSDADRFASPSLIRSDERAAVLARLRAAVPESPYFGMCFSSCMLCLADDPNHEPDCAWVAAQTVVSAAADA